jgi:hypothetical protein
MFIVIGWAKDVKESGPAIDCYCYRCQRKRRWEQWKEIEWVKLYFIKVIPFIYKTYFICEACREPVKLDWVRWWWLGDRNRWPQLVQFVDDRQLAQKSDYQRNFLLEQRVRSEGRQ